ncbi:hypothetical protein QMG83_00565 [Salinibacterium sp. G-O1]|uniref:hypothetical protein n=1 Tax=Salinibacterium sp. G-O1 TaxID=3046208 RepID=UPI0024B89180|nr:hypothetical protein [Salinibacterium sp. G-O1]MDJ0333707.1 hypothetical protein [Salinibacterium sp. G-O1]
MNAPTRKDRTRPLELLIISAVLGLFAGLVVFMSTREIVLALIFLGVAFIVSLVVLAMLALAVQPTGDEKIDLAEQDDEQGNRPLGH